MCLEKLRESIDKLDESLVKLINERALIVRQIGRLKAEGSTNVYAPAREKAVYDHAASANKGPISDKALTAVFREIMSGCIALEKPLRIAYLGPEGTFTHWAALSKFGDCVAYVPCGSMDEVFTEAERKRVDYGVVPVENSSEGGIRETLSRFLESAVRVCAEITLDIHHALLAKGPIGEITKVYSKGTVFAQTRGWLKSNLPGVDLVDVASTGRGAELAAREPGAAAIGHASLAAAYGLNVLADNIEDLAHNVTRFFVLGDHTSEPTGNDKTTILCSVKDKPGALYDLLKPFKDRDVNMTFIESFPSPRVAWQYYFFIDLTGHPEDEGTRLALEKMRQECETFRVLGAYPRCAE